MLLPCKSESKGPLFSPQEKDNRNQVPDLSWYLLLSFLGLKALSLSKLRIVHKMVEPEGEWNFPSELSLK